MGDLSGGVLAQIAKGGFYIPSAGDAGLSGKVVGEVELVRLLANGATSDVWEGVNRATHEPVAVKIACRSDDADLKARFEHEARLLGEVLPDKDGDAEECPFPRYYGGGEYKGRSYLVTEILNDVEIPDDEGLFHDFFFETLDAVAALHAKGYIHQDLKPTNLMRRRSNGKLVLIDFGQAHRIEQGRILPQEKSLTLDSEGRRLATGTAGYCAPEQLEAERSAFLPATDIYALGMLIRNFCRGNAMWTDVGNDATDPDLARRLQNVDALRRSARTKTSRNRRKAVEMILDERERRRACHLGTWMVSWEKLVTMDLARRRRIAQMAGVEVKASGPVRVMLLSGQRVLLDTPLHFTDETVVYVIGGGTLDMDVSAEKGVVFVLGGDCTVINRSARQEGIDYFCKNGSFLCFPQIPEKESQEIRRHVHLASFDGAFVQFGAAKSRDEINASYREEWERAWASLGITPSVAVPNPEDGIPVILRQR